MAAKINNIKSYAKKCNFIVAREYNDELWFFGAWDDESAARKTAKAVGGIVINRDQCENIETAEDDT